MYVFITCFNRLCTESRGALNVSDNARIRSSGLLMLWDSSVYASLKDVSGINKASAKRIALSSISSILYVWEYSLSGLLS